MRSINQWKVWVAGGVMAAGMGAALGAGIGPAMPATQSVAQAVSAPPLAVATALAEGGRYVLVTVASPGFRSGTEARVPQLLRLDMDSGAGEVVSAGMHGEPGNDASGVAWVSAQGDEVLFESRASNLVAGDTNAGWDVFRRDLRVGETRMVSGVPEGPAGRWESRGLGVSFDGTWLVHQAALYGLGTAVQQARNVRTGELWAEGSAALSNVVEPRFSAGSGRLMAFQGPYYGLGWSAVTLLDFEARTNGLVAVEMRSNGFRPGSISKDGRYLSWTRVQLGRPLLTNRVECLDTLTGELTLILERENISTSDLMLSCWSPEGKWLGFPMRAAEQGSTNFVTQMHLWNRETQELLPITVAAEGGGMGSGDSLYPVVGPGASNVVFVSDATNLLTGGLAPGRRVYRWERATGEVTVVFETLGAVGGLDPVSSADGKYVAAAAANAEGGVMVQVMDLTTGEVRKRVFAPEQTESVTGRGDVWRSGTVASADGRWLATMASPDPEKPVQVFLVDRWSGERTLVSRGVDGLPATANCWLGGMSSDGERVLFLSSATNLVAGKTGNWTDALVYSRSQTGLLTSSLAWRGDSTQSVTMNASLSPDGRWLVVPADHARLVDLEGAKNPVITPGNLWSPVSFSKDGSRMLLGVGETGLEVHSVEPMLAGQPSLVWGTNSSTLYWSSLSPDGAKVAYVESAGSARNLTVLEFETGRVLMTWSTSSWPLFLPANSFSADSRSLVWTLAKSSQVWRGNLETGGTSLVSVGTDGFTAGDGDSVLPALSPEGRWVAFASTAGNLVAQGGPAGIKQVYVRDMVAGRTFRVSRTGQGEAGAGWSTRPWFSGDGKQLFFVSEAANLADGDLNGLPDLLTVALADAGEAVVLVESAGPAAVVLRWAGKPGKSYRVQYKEALQADWSAMDGTFGSEDSVEVDTVSGARFFRLVER